MASLATHDGDPPAALVGRRLELEILEGILRDLAPATRSAVLVTGEPGIGKTRLLQELCARARQGGLDVLAGRGSEFEQSVPFGLIVDAFDGRLGALAPDLLIELGDERLAELAAVMPSLAGTGRELGNALEAERYRLHRAVRSALELLARDQPLLVALDDVHWADPASMEFVSHMLVRGIPGSVLALAYRPQRVSPTLMSAIATVARDGDLRTLELAPLSLGEAAELLGEDTDPASLSALHAEAGGNPFYLQQLARVGGPSAQRTLLDGLFGPAPGGRSEAAVPASLTTAIAGELAVLPPGARRLLEAAAVAGEPCELDLAAEIAGLDWSSALEGLDELAAVALVRSPGAARELRFRHPIVRRAVYAATTPGRRLDAHRRAAHAMAARGAELGARAHHVERSAVVGDEEAVATLTAAGHLAASRAPAAAVRWFEAALRLLPDNAETARRHSLLIALAAALASAGRLHESRTVLTEALEQLPFERGETREQITAMIARGSQSLGEGAEARRMLRGALARVDSHSAKAAAFHLELADNHFMAGEWLEARALARTAHGLAQMVGDNALLIAAAARVAYVAPYVGGMDEARARMYQASSGIDRLSDQELTPILLEGLADLAGAELALEHLGAADEHARRGARISRTTGHGYHSLRFMIVHSAIKMTQGRLADARSLADAAVEASVLFGNDALLAYAGALRTRILWMLGDIAGALKSGEEAVEAAARAPGAMYAWKARVYYGDALIRAGQLERGRHQILAAGGPELTDIPPGDRTYWHRALAQVEVARGDIEAAEAMTLCVEHDAAISGHPGALADARLARSSVLAGRGDLAGAARLALEAAELGTAAENPIWVATARLAAGRALRNAGQPHEAARELELAFAGSEVCGAGRLADQAAKELRELGKRVRRTRARAEPGGLTARELDVASRVAQGHTNREIAAELFLSEKTVERHMTRVFAKLRVSSRAAVAAAVERSRADGAQHPRVVSTHRRSGESIRPHLDDPPPPGSITLRRP